MTSPLILGLESSCDDSAAALLRGREVLASIVKGQNDLHADFGGVVPEIAARAHAERLDLCVEEALAQAGVALNPGTPAQAIEHLLDLTDLVCVMTVNPGFGGQKFIDMTSKVRTLRQMIGDRPVHIEIDGGVDPTTAPLVVDAGADVLVAGSAVFRGGSVENPAPYGENIRAIRTAATTLAA